MTCPVCPTKLSRASYDLIHKACGPCQRQIKQMMAGFRGVMPEAKVKTTRWDNTAAYEAWKAKLTDQDEVKVHLNNKAEYVEQRCDIRDMKRVVGIPKLLDLEKQVFTAWMIEGTKDERIREVLGLTYSQLFHIKRVIKGRLQKQMAYYHQIKKLEKEGKSNEAR